MSNLFLTSAIRDIIPTHPEPYPNEVISYANSLYTTSKRTLPLSTNEEIARYHLCCYVTIEYFQPIYKLPDPFVNKIPMPNRKLFQLLQTFRTNFNTMIASTPRAKRVVDIGLGSLPTPSSIGKNEFSVSTQSYIDQVRANNYQTADKVKRSLQDALLTESSTYQNKTPPSTPQKTPRSGKKSTSGTTSSFKLSPYRSRTKVVITTPILVSFCNKFYIPEHISKYILQTFKLYQHIVTNSWGLLVGLVGISYLQLNKTMVSRRIGMKSRLVTMLHRSQQGGLSDVDVKNYLCEVTRMISKSKWIKEARYADDYENSSVLNNSGNETYEQDLALSSLGSFIDGSVEYVTMKNTARVEGWVKKIKQQKKKVRRRLIMKGEEEDFTEAVEDQKKTIKNPFMT